MRTMVMALGSLFSEGERVCVSRSLSAVCLQPRKPAL